MKFAFKFQTDFDALLLQIPFSIIIIVYQPLLYGGEETCTQICTIDILFFAVYRKMRRFKPCPKFPPTLVFVYPPPCLDGPLLCDVCKGQAKTATYEFQRREGIGKGVVQLELLIERLKNSLIFFSEFFACFIDRFIKMLFDFGLKMSSELPSEFC